MQVQTANSGKMHYLFSEYFNLENYPTFMIVPKEEELEMWT